MSKTIAFYKMIVALAFISGACYLLINDHPVAGGWMIFGAIISSGLTVTVDEKRKKP